MTAKIINLRQARKARARAAREQTAAENRIRHGCTKTERRQTAAEREVAERRLDGHRRKDGPDVPNGREPGP